MISDIGYLSLRLKHTLQPSFIKIYKDIAQFMKNQENLFILSKGAANFVSTFAAFKFNSICAIHAEAYGSAEFRHGPLAMLDEDEKTATIFLVLDDENLEQVLANILQVKERGATVIVCTNLRDIYLHVKPEKIDFLIQLQP